jgi:hypothetical protein
MQFINSKFIVKVICISSIEDTNVHPPCYLTTEREYEQKSEDKIISVF